ncbi:MAG: LacI family DNA-binding transcriptional regulator [Planctomycetota bacterium]|nr:LacI family DNA-binding transcriptional regulator [Planctomycetota bacterium]
MARKVGVSIATVSKAIGGKPDVSKETRKRVLKVAGELGFSPNASARALARGRTDVLGVTLRNMNYLSGPYIGSIVSGIAEISDQNGFGLLFAKTIANTGQKYSEYIQFAKEKRFDGVFIMDQRARESDIRLFSEMNVPAVLVDRKISGNALPTVCVNYRKAVCEAVSYLIGLGHHRIALISPYFKVYEYKEKLAGYKDALESHGLSLDKQLIPKSPEILATDTLRQVVEMVEDLPAPPTAYMCLSDALTLPLFDVLTSRGLRVPEDVSFIGFDVFGSVNNGVFSLSLINIPGHDLGVYACQLLLNLLKGKAAAKDVVLDATFEPRKTCASPGR